MLQHLYTLTKYFYLVIIFLLCSTSFANSSVSNIDYSLRIRPIAILYGIPGVEAFATHSNGYFIGPTFHFFSEENDLNNSSLKGSVVGLKFGRVFPDGVPHQGWFIFGNINYLNARMSNFYSTTQQTFSGSINLWYESLFVGYQFNSLIFGPNEWDVRLGVGMVYRPDRYLTFKANNSDLVPVGIRERLDPSLEFTIGYCF